jgi:carboxylesterase type B
LPHAIFENNFPIQEDCLFLDVYVPESVINNPNALLPVLFWIHGGGYGTMAERK